MNDDEKLKPIGDIYLYVEVAEPVTYLGSNPVRWNPVAWDLAQIFGAIATGRKIRLSPHYKGVQIVRRNKQLWSLIQEFVELKPGRAKLPGDDGRFNDDEDDPVSRLRFYETPCDGDPTPEPESEGTTS